MSARIAILDYGMGNRRSVEKALEHVGARATITRARHDLEAADGVVVPGVGAFPEAMRRLRELDLDQILCERVDAGAPLLGICLGMQVLFERSDELGGAEGLGAVAGQVSRLDPGDSKLPHIGWNVVRWQRDSPLTAGLEPECAFYHVHSHVARPADDADVLGTAEYGERFVSAVDRDPVFGVQFHPEKSSTHGLRLLENFSAICARVAA
ncbi:MAG TPA: imidazole glycerol phosphate synthase subunit HisH [Solirubrobacteraceae bacterium]|jgi:glutamine amidotransferase